MHESALRDFAVTNFRANGCAYFKLAEEAAAAAVQLKALLLDHGDELREWLGKDVFNTMDSEQRKKLKQEVPDGTFVDDGRLQISEVDMRLTARAGGRLDFRKSPSRFLLSASSATRPPSSQLLPSCADTTLLPRLSHADMPIETIFAKNQFLTLMPLLGMSAVRFIRGTHSVKKLGDTTTSATAITVAAAPIPHLVTTRASRRS